MPEGCTDLDDAEKHLESSMGDLMTQHDWGVVLDFKPTKIGYDLKTPAQEQAEARSYRKSQSNKKVRTITVNDDTIDPVVEEILNNKKEALDKLLGEEATTKNMSEEQMIQQQVNELTRPLSDIELCALIDGFVFSNPVEGSGKLTESFLKDTGLELAFVNYMSDVRDPQKWFHRSSHTDINMINKVRSALLVRAYARFSVRVEMEKRYPETN